VYRQHHVTVKTATKYHNVYSLSCVFFAQSASINPEMWPPLARRHAEWSRL